eukprot:5818046-Pyramimonas_sp.AAC.1
MCARVEWLSPTAWAADPLTSAAPAARVVSNSSQQAWREHSSETASSRSPPEGPSRFRAAQQRACARQCEGRLYPCHGR